VTAPVSVGFRADGRPVAWGCKQQVLHLWNPVSGAAITPPGGHRVPVHALGFGGDGRFAYALDQQARLLHWDLATGKELRSFSFGRLLYGKRIWGMAAFAPDGRELVVPDYSENLVILDPRTGRKRQALGAEHVWSAGWQVAFAADGSQLGGFVNVHRSFPNREFPVLIRDQVREKVISGVTADFRGIGEGTPRTVSGAFSRDGRRVAVAVAVGDERDYTNLTGWDLDAKKKLATWRLPGSGWRGMAVAADSRSVVVTGAGGKLVVCDMLHGRVKGTIDRRWGDVLAGPLFSPDGRTFAIATDDHKGNAAIRILEWASWEERHVFRAGPALALAYAPDGRTLLSGQDDTTILLWDLAGGRVGTETPSARLWQQLHEDAGVAGRAVQELASRPAVAVALLRDRLKVPAASPRAAVQKLIARLGADTFEERQAASAGLARYRSSVEPALRAALAAKPDLEVRRRLERLLASLERPTKEEVGQIRCVEVLQRAGTPQARGLLKELAGGPEGFLSREAARTLRGLDRRKP
jgi:WD40 repeat protein